ncbi:hypothetical protein E1956_18665 [Paraburkholderia pallida]|uniref:Uncharacterized protein n=1 Tax=Paraburkholderia pallida TaxID=2547399 RepID=A0A4P7CTA8_9BURK|nr:hypothetical protein E1956_18665 [Paraburkholderia pallida]
MFGLESMLVGVWVTVGDGFFGSAAIPRIEDERAAQTSEQAAPTTCISCGSTKDERGELPCGH